MQGGGTNTGGQFRHQQSTSEDRGVDQRHTGNVLFSFSAILHLLLRGCSVILLERSPALWPGLHLFLLFALVVGVERSDVVQHAAAGAAATGCNAF